MMYHSHQCLPPAASSSSSLHFSPSSCTYVVKLGKENPGDLQHNGTMSSFKGYFAEFPYITGDIY